MPRECCLEKAASKTLPPGGCIGDLSSNVVATQNCESDDFAKGTRHNGRNTRGLSISKTVALPFRAGSAFSDAWRNTVMFSLLLGLFRQAHPTVCPGLGLLVREGWLGDPRKSAVPRSDG
jgi:hypothetical protein